jgi:hypothetical protein
MSLEEIAQGIILNTYCTYDQEQTIIFLPIMASGTLLVIPHQMPNLFYM